LYTVWGDKTALEAVQADYAAFQKKGAEFVKIWMKSLDDDGGY
jgi:hypothetical protein